MKTEIATEPRLYVGTYAKYNAGSLKGAWLDLSDYADRGDFMEACRKLHEDEPDPEIMFQDFEGFPRAWYCESSAPGDILWEWLELDENEQEAFGAYADHMGGDVEIDDFRESYQGAWSSEADYAQNLAEDCGEIPKDLPAWIVIDWQASWDCSLRFDYFAEQASNGDVHIFRSI